MARKLSSRPASHPGAGNTPPVADAGLDQTAIVGLPIVLDGSGSFDPDGDPISYDWRFATPDASAPFPAGSNAVLSGATTVEPSFTADLPGAYSVELTVDDGIAGSTPDYVTVKAISLHQAIDLLKYDLTALAAGGGLTGGSAWRWKSSSRWLSISLRTESRHGHCTFSGRCATKSCFGKPTECSPPRRPPPCWRNWIVSKPRSKHRNSGLRSGHLRRK